MLPTTASQLTNSPPTAAPARETAAGKAGPENGPESSAHIERLPFDGSIAYSALEAAIHLNRYLIVRSLCRDRRVLDLACGEGYGSFLMANNWGAASVAGVDISEDAIANARKLFPSPKVEYQQHAAEKVEGLFEPASFDLVVSLETIEHVADPKLVLQNIRALLRPGGLIAISCPNDHWYYRGPGEHNPFHQRQYTLREFLELTEGVLGPATQLMLGTPLAGFMNVPIDRSGRGALAERDPKAILAARDRTLSLLPPQEEIRSEESSYFVALWGPREALGVTEQGAIFPLTMTSNVPAAQAQHISNLQDEVRAIATQRDEAVKAMAKQRDEAQSQRDEAQSQRDAAWAQHDKVVVERAREVRHLGLRLEAVSAENDHLREEIFFGRQSVEKLKEENALLQPSTIPLKNYLLFSRDFVRAKIPGFPTRVRNLGRRAVRKAASRFFDKL